jgi:hypothetical protein
MLNFYENIFPKLIMKITNTDEQFIAKRYSSLSIRFFVKIITSSIIRVVINKQVMNIRSYIIFEIFSFLIKSLIINVSSDFLVYSLMNIKIFIVS